MFSGIIWILMAWFIPMPLVLSILMTFYGAIRIYAYFKDIDISEV